MIWEKKAFAHILRQSFVYTYVRTYIMIMKSVVFLLPVLQPAGFSYFFRKKNVNKLNKKKTK